MILRIFLFLASIMLILLYCLATACLRCILQSIQ